MKKHRKQLVYVDGQKHLIDVPVDDELYKADNHAEYQRVRSKQKDSTLELTLLADESADIMADFEEKQLLEALHKALSELSETERKLIDSLFYRRLTERDIAKSLGISQQAVGKRKYKVLQKLRESLIDWL